MKKSNKKETQLIVTDDGSHSLFVPSLNETYHSFHGAVQESRHVFIAMGLSYLVSSNEKKVSKPVRIFEVGFGTGLNALLTAEFAIKHRQPVHFTSIEAFPLDPSIAEKLNYASFLDNPDATTWFTKMHHAPWNIDKQVLDYFTLKKINMKLQDFMFEPDTFDLIFFDAFAPGKQAELWEVGLLEKVINTLACGGIFVTYCARGQLKRDLQSLGTKVDTLPGPPGKKEMVRAIKL